jgi:sulfate adenylyltransferase
VNKLAAAATEPSLNAPYGGVLVDRIVDRSAVNLDCLPELAIDDIAESDLVNIAVGAFSPLEGFMGAKTLASVLERSLLPVGLPWTIPIALALDEAQRRMIGDASRVALRSAESGRIVGVIEVDEIYPHDKETRIAGTFGVADDAHPGVRVVRAMGPWLLSGKVWAFRDALSDDPLAYPRGVRARLTEMGLTRVAGFQTRNVVHRAHEHLQRIALEVCGGLLVHPVVGWKKAGDFRPEAVRRGYEAFIRDYYPSSKVLLAFLKVAMRYAGPKEAVFHAIIRKNYGCSHFIVGRDHAGVGGYYDTYAAHKIFEALPPLGIEILRLREPFFCFKCDGLATDYTCGHSDADREYISGTKVRKILVEGSDPAHHIFRADVLDSLRPLKETGLFYD